MFFFFFMFLLISSMSNIWFLWLSSSLSSLYWPRAQFMFFLWNKVGVSGSWDSGLRWFWFIKLKENHVNGSYGCFPLNTFLSTLMAYY